MTFQHIATCAVLACLATGIFSAQARTWRSASGDRTFEADFVSHDTVSVTVKKPDGDEMTFPITRLHEADQVWVKGQPREISAEVALEPDNKAAFETLHFGDSRDTVVEKLKVSQIVTSGMVEELSGRTGLNGMFHTREKIGGYSYSLYFGWNAQDRLKEVILRSEPAGNAAYTGAFRTTWSSMIDLLNTLHGRPVLETDYPDSADLQNGMALNSHLWRLDSGGSALLGIGKENDQFVLTATFTQEHIKPTPAN